MNLSDFWVQCQKIISSTLSALNVYLPWITSTNIHTWIEELTVVSKSHICTDNSTSTPLWINGIFQGNWQDTLDYTEVIVSIFANQPSITDWLIIEWSSNASTVHWDDIFTISASSGKTFSFPCQNRYVRITYKNDWVAQTVFNIETLLKRFASKGSSHRLKDNLVQEDDAIVTKSLIAWFSTAWGWSLVNVKVNPSWAVQIGWTIDQISNSKPFLIDENWIEHQMLWDTYFAWSPVVIDLDHHEIHCWDSIMTTRVIDLTNWAQDNILIVTPNPTPTSKRYHLVWDISSEAECDLLIYEDTTTSNNWTALASFNRNRQDPVASNELSFYHTPTVTWVWTLIYSDHWWSWKSSWWEWRWQHEVVLKNNTKYLVRITNATTSNNHTSEKFNYYIHPWI